MATDPAATGLARTTALADALLALRGTGAQIAPPSAGPDGLTLAEAHAVADRLRALRAAGGARPVGRKIGFTNRTIWEEYGVRAPIWGWVWDDTLSEAAAAPLAGLPEPRIEPEIVFGLGRAPEPGMPPAALLGCVDWVALGFEIVQSPFPGWVFAAADTVAGFGLHGRLHLGPRRAPGGDRAAWGAALERFTAELACDGAVVARGHAADVLGGPLHALAHLADLLAAEGPALAAGELVSTGTLTRALPVAPRQNWTARVAGLDLPPLTLRLD